MTHSGIVNGSGIVYFSFTRNKLGYQFRPPRVDINCGTCLFVGIFVVHKKEYLSEIELLYQKPGARLMNRQVGKEENKMKLLLHHLLRCSAVLHQF